MTNDRRSKDRRFAAFVLLGCVTLTVYFAHHAMYGRFGIENSHSLSASSKGLADRLSALRKERAALERDISLLSGAPHPDMIEEAARRVLGYAYPQMKLLPLTR